jgi:hypothetical protein
VTTVAGSTLRRAARKLVGSSWARMLTFKSLHPCSKVSADASWASGQNGWWGTFWSKLMLRFSTCFLLLDSHRHLRVSRRDTLTMRVLGSLGKSATALQYSNPYEWYKVPAKSPSSL